MIENDEFLGSEEEKVLAEQDDSNSNPPPDVVAFNELRSCADLVRMYSNGQLLIDPDFQRDVVWVDAAQTRFVDSLIKQLPIPSICISLDYKSNKRIVIDGLQRMSSIIRFLTDENWRLSSLGDVDDRISGKKIAYIKQNNPEVFELVENVTIPVTVLRCDSSKKEHMEYIFTIFHRLNTGGNKLCNQEIRNCIYSGDFNNLLKNTVKSNVFKDVFDIKPNKSYRFQHEELLLRFFAFYDALDSYNGKLSRFLNEYMQENRNPTELWLEEKKKLVDETLHLVSEKILGGEAFVKLSKAVMESIFVGVAKNLVTLRSKNSIEVKSLYKKLMEDELFQAAELKSDLSATDKVKGRISRSIEIFGG